MKMRKNFKSFQGSSQKRICRYKSNNIGNLLNKWFMWRKPKKQVNIFKKSLTWNIFQNRTICIIGNTNVN